MLKPTISGGSVYNDLGNSQKALKDYIQVIRLDSAGKAYRRDNERALKGYTEIIRINPSFAQAYYRGLACFYLRDCARSPTEDFIQAIRLNPGYAQAYYYRGRAGGGQGGRIEDFTQAIQLNPNFADAYYQRGRTRYDEGDKQGAIEDFSQAIRLNPKSAEAYYHRGLLRFQIGDEQGAISDYIQTLSIEPKIWNYIEFLGNSYWENYLAPSKEAAENYIQMLRTIPRDADAYYRRGFVRYDLRDYKGA
jgi:tetratricopeptide (TPR) repeat protein